MITQNELAQPDVLDRAPAIFDRLDKSEATRADHKWHIAEFVNFMQDHALTSDSYLDFKRALASRTDLAISTKNKYLVSASILLKELARQGLIPRDITLGVHHFQQSKGHKREGVTEDEMHRLVGYLRGLAPTAANKRLRALIALLGLQGLRQVEVHRLDVADLDLVSRTAFVQGKGRDDKEIVDLHPQTVRVLREHLKASRIADGPVFPSGHRGHRQARLTTRAMHMLVSELYAAAGIEDKTPHDLRHFFATTLLTNHPGDLLEKRRYTRHHDLQQLLVYDGRIRSKADRPKFYQAFAEFAL